MAARRNADERLGDESKGAANTHCYGPSIVSGGIIVDAHDVDGVCSCSFSSQAFFIVADFGVGWSKRKGGFDMLDPGRLVWQLTA